MKLIRVVLLVATAAFAWRVLRGRGHQAMQRAVGRSRPATGTTTSTTTSVGQGSHTSAASAANEGFRDDRDIVVGENLSAVGMRPGAL